MHTAIKSALIACTATAALGAAGQAISQTGPSATEHPPAGHAQAGLSAAGQKTGSMATGTNPPAPGATINDPPGPLPDPGHVPLVFPKDIKCRGTEGVSQTCSLFGDPDRPGLYGVLIKWWPGHFSRPHFHDQDRFIYVISGTWWVSTSNVYDERTTYPVHAGMVSTDVKNTVHWDGARSGEKEPAVLELVGMGPVKTIPVDENGRPKSGR